jgi:hypothetical protein
VEVYVHVVGPYNVAKVAELHGVLVGFDGGARVATGRVAQLSEGVADDALAVEGAHGHAGAAEGDIRTSVAFLEGADCVGICQCGSSQKQGEMGCLEKHGEDCWSGEKIVVYDGSLK